MNFDKPQPTEHEHQVLPDSHTEQSPSVNESRRRFATKTGLAASGVLLTLASRSALGAGVCKSPSGFASGNVSQHGTTPKGGENITYWTNNCTSWVGLDPSKSFSEVFGFTDTKNFGIKIFYKFNARSTYEYDIKSNPLEFVPYTLLDILSRFHVGYKPIPSTGYGKTDVIKLTNSKKKNNFYTNGKCTDLSTGSIIYRAITENTPIDMLAQHCVAALINSRAGKTPFLSESTIKDIFKSCYTNGAFEPTTGVTWTIEQCISYIQSTWNCA